MEIKYNEKIDTKYFLINKGKVVRTNELNDWALLDYDKNNEVVGMEVLQASKNLVSLSTIEGKLNSVVVIELSKLDLPNQGVSMSIETSQEKLFTPSQISTPLASYA